MPTDESYLDSLLSGLSSNLGSSDERLSSYRKDRNSNNRDGNVAPEREIPDFLSDYVSREDKNLQFHELPEEEPGDFFFEEENPESISRNQETEEIPKPEIDDDTIEGYNIFDDYDDEAIDRMIDEELSGDKVTGEPFVVQKNDFDDYSDSSIIDDFEERMSEKEDYVEKEETYEENPSDNIFMSDDEMPAVFENAAMDANDDTAPDDVFGELTSDDLFSDGDINENEEQPEDGIFRETDLFTAENADDNDESQVEDSSDILGNLLGRDETTEENLLGGDDIPEETVFGEEETTEENLFGGEETAEENLLGGDETTEENLLGGDDSLFGDDPLGLNDPLADLGEGADDSDGGHKESARDLLGAMNVDTLNEEDIEALDNLFNEIDVDTSEDSEKTVKKKKEKKPWYLALFGNVKLPEDKIKPEPTPEQLEEMKAKEEEEKKAAAEAKKAAKEEKKKAAAEAKANKAKQTAEEKEAIKAKKREEIDKLILEETDNSTRINKAGSVVIFAIFLGIAALILSSGKTISYKTQIKQAQQDYDNALLYQDVKFYSDAYDDIYGLELEEEDYKLGEKIYTVNFVSKQISSFNNHYALGDYTGALNDLFKGLLRYNKWIPYAIELGADDDLYFVRTQILALLEDNYGISEDTAMKVLSTYDGISETDGDAIADLYYTKYIYSTVREVGLENNKKND